MQDVQRQKLNPRTPDVLLIGDFNISLTALDCYPRLRTEYPHNIARAQFNDEIIPGMGVLDVYREKYGKVKAYSWFAVGKPYRSDCARVDFALATKVACDAVEKMEYLERSCGQSDHCPLLLTLDMSKLDRVAGRHVDGDGKRSKMG
jgi:exodeoxyribonuclease-3